MALGALEDMVNGPTRTAPRLSRRAQHLLRIANASEKDRLQEVVRRASQVLGREYELASRLSRQHRPSQPPHRESSQPLQQSQPVQLSPLTAKESKPAALVPRARQVLRRLVKSLRWALRRSLPHLPSLPSAEKWSSALQVSALSARLLLVASLNGIHRAMHRQAGTIRQRLQTPGQINLQQAIRGAGNRLRQLPGQIKQALRRIGRKLHRS